MSTVRRISPGAIGLDYSVSRPSAATMHAVGVEFVCRILTDEDTAFGKEKLFHPSELDELWTADFQIGVLLNWENSSGDFRSGLGAAFGERAAELASGFGYPKELPIIVAVDTEVADSDLRQVHTYFEAFQGAADGYPIGVYGQQSVAAELDGIVSFGWGINATGWSEKGWKGRDLQQVPPDDVGQYPAIANAFKGVPIDINVAQRELGVWVSGANGGSTSGSSASTPTYTVAAGDSWWRIAETQMGSGSDAEALAEFNGMTTSDVIHPGDVVKIPTRS